MAATQLQMFNRALSMIGAKRLESMLIDREARYELEDAYSYTIQYCLEQGMWRFAMRTAAPTAAALPTRDYGYTHAFTVPTDLIHTYLIGVNDAFSPPVSEALEADGYYFARQTPIYVRYTSNNASYGADITRWPNVFVDYFTAELASRVAYTITRDKEIWQSVAGIAAARLIQARATDAMMGSTGILPYNALVRREFNAGSNFLEPFPFPLLGTEQETAQ